MNIDDKYKQNSNKPFTRLELGGRPPKWADELLSTKILRNGYIVHNNCDNKYIFTWEGIKGYVDLGGYGLSYDASPIGDLKMVVNHGSDRTD
jgi:hypothetical protein